MADDSLILASCLTDKPVETVEKDDLRAEDYAKALARFISKASTPVTIGIQGGWGSGKTSLITVLKKMLDEDPDHSTLCVVVNAWEHSLLQNPDSRAEVALSMLEALAEGLTEEAARTPWLNRSTVSAIKNDDAEIIGKALGGLKLGALFAGKVAAQMVSNMIGGGDISSVKVENVSRNMSMLPQMSKSVRELRISLKDILEKITYNGKKVKIVFFIDDLDRVPPATAVEILDITKNIFDMPQCVFVLAIDYEVVVKGLEKKFGQKTRDNEREFRQYFDKIIQIPFTMPLGAYGDNIVELLKSSFEDLGYKLDENSSQILARLATDAKLATGGLPRSIKRILNTLSLLQHISIAKQKKASDAEITELPPDMETKFIIIAIHINFPEIARRLMERPDFTKWYPEDLDTPWNLNLDANRDALKLLENDNLFNDPWEKTVYCLAASSPWLKSMARNLSNLLNNLLASLGGDPENATFIPEDGLNKLKSVLKSISVVSVDNVSESGLDFNTKDLKKHPTNQFFSKFQDTLAKALPTLAPHENEIIVITDDGNYSYAVESLDAPHMVYTEFVWVPDRDELSIFIVSQKPGSRKDNEDVINKMRGEYDWAWEDRNFYYYFTCPFKKEDFLKTDNINSLVEQTCNLYKQVQKVQAKLFA